MLAFTSCAQVPRLLPERLQGSLESCSAVLRTHRKAAWSFLPEVLCWRRSWRHRWNNGSWRGSFWQIWRRTWGGKRVHESSSRCSAGNHLRWPRWGSRRWPKSDHIWSNWVELQASDGEGWQGELGSVAGGRCSGVLSSILREEAAKPHHLGRSLCEARVRLEFSLATGCAASNWTRWSWYQMVSQRKERATLLARPELAPAAKRNLGFFVIYCFLFSEGQDIFGFCSGNRLHKTL